MMKVFFAKIVNTFQPLSSYTLLMNIIIHIITMEKNEFVNSLHFPLIREIERKVRNFGNS